MSKHFLPILLLTGFTASLAAQTVNWASDIAPILYDHCVQCHRVGGIGHFSLIGYDNAFSFKNSIRSMTESRQMPPWKADPEYRHFAGENILTDTEIQKIQAWVAAGAPAGNLNQAPSDPVFGSGSAIGAPDLALTTPLHS